MTLCMTAFIGCSCGDNGGDGPIVEKLPPAPEVEATLALDIQELSLTVGEEKYISAQTNNLDGYTLSFASNNDKVACVDNSGKITAFSEGTAVITATYTNGTKTKTATCNLAVGFGNYVPFLEIEGGLEDVTQIALNDKLAVTPFVSFNNISFYDATFEYSSLDSSIVEVNENGELVAKAIGETFIVVNATWRDKTSADFKTLTNTFKVKVINSVIFLANGTPLEDVNLFTRNSFYGKNYDVSKAFALTATVNGEAYTGNIKVSIENGAIATYSANKIQSKGYGETTAKVSIDYNGESYGDTFKIKVDRPVVEIEEEVLKFSTFSGTFKDVSNGLQDTTLVQKFFEPGKTIYDAYQYMEDGTMKALTFSGDYVYDIVSSDADMAGSAKIILGTSTERYILNLETYGQLFSTPEDLLYLVVNQEKKLTGYCELLNDVDATGLTFDHDENLLSKAGFYGVFEGNGHVIRNVTLQKVTGADYGESLFGAIGASAILRNFALYNLSATECYFIAQSATNGHTIENVYINVSSSTSTPKGITNAMGDKNNYKAIVVDYFASNDNMGLTDAGIPNFKIGHNGSKAEYSSFAGNVYRNSGFNKLNDGTWKDVYVFSKLPVLNYSNLTLNATDVSTFNLPATFNSNINPDGNMATRVTAIGYGVNETVDLWGNEIDDTAPVVDIDPSYSNEKDPYNIKRFFFNLRFSNVYRYDSYEELASDKDNQGENKWDNFDSKYWMISNGIPYFKALYNTQIDAGFYDSNDNYVDDVLFDEQSDRFTVLFKDGGALEGIPTVSIEENDFIEVVGNVIKVKAGATIPTVPHEYVVTASQNISGVNYVKTKVITVAKAINAIEDRVIFEADSGKILYSKLQGDVTSFTVVDSEGVICPTTVENGAVANAVVRNNNGGNAELGLKVKLGDSEFTISSTDGEFNGTTVYIETTNDVYKFTNVEFVSKILKTKEDLAYLSIDATSGNKAPYVILGDNIDAEGYKHTHASLVNTTNRLSYSFNGIFDGKGYTISNLDLTNNVGGLFGAFDYSAVVRNVGLYNVKAVNSPILAIKAKLPSVTFSETENNGIKYDKNGTKVYPYMQFNNIYVKLQNGSNNVKGLISIFENNHTYEMNNVVVDFENAPTVAIENGVVKENGVEVQDTIGILQASTTDKAIGFNARQQPNFTNVYYITSYPLMFRNTALTPKDQYLYNGTNGYADRLSKNTTIGQVWGIARNGVAPIGVTKTVKDKGADVNAFSYIVDIRSEQYATKQDLINAQKDLSSFNEYWDISSGAPQWKSAITASIDVKVEDEKGEVEEVLFDNASDTFTITFKGETGITGTPTITVEENDYIEAVGNVIKVKQGANLPVVKEEIAITVSQTIGGKLYEKEIVVYAQLLIEDIDMTGYVEEDGTFIVEGLDLSNVSKVYYSSELAFSIVENNLVATLPTLTEELGEDVIFIVYDNNNEFKVLSLKYVTEYITSVKEFKESIEIGDLSAQTSVEGYTQGDLYNDGYYLLGCDLDFTGETINHVTDDYGFSPTYGKHRPFVGYFDGQGYAIKNVTTNKNSSIFGTFALKAHVKNLAIIDFNFTSASASGTAGNNYKKTAGLLASADSLGSNYNDGGAIFEDLYITVKDLNYWNNAYQVKSVLTGVVMNARTTFRNIVVEADIESASYPTGCSAPILFHYASGHVYSGGTTYNSAKANTFENVFVISKDKTNTGKVFRMTRMGLNTNPSSIAYNDWVNNQSTLADVPYWPEYYYTDSDGNATFTKPENYTGESTIVLRRYDDYTAFANDSKTDKTSLGKFNSDMWVVSNGAVYYKGIYNDQIKAVAYDNENEAVEEIIFDDATDSYTFGFADSAIVNGEVSITLNGETSNLVVDGNKVKVSGTISGTTNAEIVISQEINGKKFTATYTAIISNEKYLTDLVCFDASTGKFDSEEIVGTVVSAKVNYGEEDYILTVNNGIIEGVTVENRTASQSFTDISKHLLFVKVGESEGAEVGFTIADDGDFNGANVEIQTAEGKIYKLSNVEFVSKVIKNQSDLATFAVTSNSDIDFGYYVLGNNIEVKDNTATTEVDESIAIAHTTLYNNAKEVANFNGIFDGKGYTITGLKTNSYGLFSTVGAYAILRNFALNDLDSSNAPILGYRLKTQTVDAGKTTSPKWLQAKFYPAIWMTDIYVKLSSDTTMPQGLYYEDFQTWYYKTTNVIIDWQNAPTIKVEGGKVYEGATELTKNVGLFTAGGDNYAKMMGSRGEISTTYTISSYPLMYKQNGVIQTQKDTNDKYYTIGFTQLSTSEAVTYTATRTFGFGRNITTMPYDGLVAMATTNASTDIAVLIHSDVYSYADNTAFASGLTSGNLKSFKNNSVWDTSLGYPVWASLPQA